MSGTSLDGLDIAHIKFSKFDTVKFEILNAKTIEYPEIWKNSLKNAYHANAVEITKLDADFGIFIGQQVNEFIKTNNITDVDFIASHGQTIFHNPTEKYTLQIGSGTHIANETKILTISDFRKQDVAFGGQGAPLVPIGDQILFSDFQYCINIGGFANISFEKNGKRLAYDICPANIVLNHYSEKLGFQYDDKGKIASKGKVNEALLKTLDNLSIYQNKNSMGYESVVNEILPLIESFNLETIDIISTFTEHIAIKISKEIDHNSKVLITGGGAYNNHLINRIKLISHNKIELPPSYLIDYKEALIFGLLGLLRLNNEINCLSSVTGAFKNHSSGVVHFP